MKPSHALNRRRFLQTSTSALASLTGAFASLTGLRTSFAGRPPNIVILYADDMGYGDLSCFDGTDVHTPHIDALAESGTRFRRWYSNAPVCSPSRAALLTGRYPQRTGLATNAERGLNSDGMNPGEVTLAEALHAAGYRTGICGKWHLGSSAACRPNAQGFDSFYGFLSGCVDYYSHIFYWAQSNGHVPYHDLWRNGQEIWENGEYLTRRLREECIRFLRENREVPFFLYAPFNAPHYPLHAPAEYFTRFASITDPQRRMQAAMISALDDAIGLVLDELDRLHLREQTLVYFQSDNGPSAEKRNLLDDSGEDYHGGSPGPFRGHKGSLFEGGIRVPAIMSWPGVIPEKRVSDDMGVTMDIFPTLMHAAGAAPPRDRNQDGIDLWPLITGNAQASPRTVFWGLAKQRAIIQGKEKLVLNGKLDFVQDHPEPVFLCDLEEDPGETTNLAADHPEKVAAFEEKIKQWETDVASSR